MATFAGQQFDIETGAGIGGPIFDGGSFTGLEYVGSTLYGTVIFGPGSASELRTLDPSTGASTFDRPHRLRPDLGPGLRRGDGRDVRDHGRSRAGRNC